MELANNAIHECMFVTFCNDHHGTSVSNNCAPRTPFIQLEIITVFKNDFKHSSSIKTDQLIHKSCFWYHLSCQAKMTAKFDV